MALDAKADTGGLPTQEQLIELNALNARISALLPTQYQHCYEDISSVSMGTASLKFGADGRVAWDEMWTSFCHLALAGGPPHRGKMLLPVSEMEASQKHAQFQRVVGEIEYGIWLAANLRPLFAQPGWVSAQCTSEVMAEWLARAIVAENVFARRKGAEVLLPAGPDFRLEKEIKNVITVLAKTCHYWTSHAAAERDRVFDYFAEALRLNSVFAPATPSEAHNAGDPFAAGVAALTRQIQDRTGITLADDQPPGWIGLNCEGETMATWLMRAAIAENVLARREEEILFLPVGLDVVEEGRRYQMLEIVARIFRAWQTHCRMP